MVCTAQIDICRAIREADCSYWYLRFYGSSNARNTKKAARLRTITWTQSIATCSHMTFSLACRCLFSFKAAMIRRKASARTKPDTSYSAVMQKQTPCTVLTNSFVGLPSSALCTVSLARQNAIRPHGSKLMMQPKDCITLQLPSLKLICFESNNFGTSFAMTQYLKENNQCIRFDPQL